MYQKTNAEILYQNSKKDPKIIFQDNPQPPAVKIFTAVIIVFKRTQTNYSWYKTIEKYL